MYLPEQYAEQRSEELHRIIRENPLGMLVRSTSTGLEAEHLPFLLDADQDSPGILRAHVARANPMWKEIRNGDGVLVIFRGEQGYISPNWYPGKHETHRRVPTWNYEIVHAHGTVHVCDDLRFVRGIVARLTRTHEAGQPEPWRMGDAPADFVTEQLRHIVGIEVHLARLDGKRKLNQHHAKQDRDGAIAGLAACGNHGLANAMRYAAPRTAG